MSATVTLTPRVFSSSAAAITRSRTKPFEKITASVPYSFSTVIPSRENGASGAKTSASRPEPPRI